MLTLAHTHVRKLTEWNAIDGTDITLQYLIDTYENIHLFVTSNGTLIRLITFEEIRQLTVPSDYGYTVSAWLLTLPDDTGREVDVRMLDDVASALFTPVWDYDVLVSMGNHNYGPGVTVPIGKNTDVIIQDKDGANSEIPAWSEYALLFVNGRVVETKLIGDRWFGVDARYYMDLYRDSPYEINVLDFRDIGKLQYVKFNTDNLRAVDKNDTDLVQRKSRLVFTPMADIRNKTPMLVMDGHLHVLDGTTDVLDANSIVLNVSNKLIARRMLRDGVDGWPGGDGVNVRNSGINVDTLDVREFLLHSNSGIILVDNNDLNIHSSPAGRTDIPNTYLLSYGTGGLLQLENGDHAHYIVNGNDGDRLSITARSGLRNIYLDESVSPDKELIFSMTSRQPRLQPLTQDVQTAKYVNIYSTRL